jgi:hypothetical protein
MIGKEGKYLSVFLDPISDGRPAVRNGTGGHQSPSYLPVILGAGVIDNSRSHQEWIEESYRDAVLSGGVECARYGITRDGGYECDYCEWIDENRDECPRCGCPSLTWVDWCPECEYSGALYKGGSVHVRGEGSARDTIRTQKRDKHR